MFRKIKGANGNIVMSLWVLALRVSTVLQHCVPFSIHFVYSLYCPSAMSSCTSSSSRENVTRSRICVRRRRHRRHHPPQDDTHTHSICECEYSV